MPSSNNLIIAWATVDSGLWRAMALLDHNELIASPSTKENKSGKSSE